MRLFDFLFEIYEGGGGYPIVSHRIADITDLSFFANICHT